MYLEDEVISVQGQKGWCRCREEEILQRGGGICPRIIATDISRTAQSEQRVEKVEDEYRRSAGPGEQRVPLGEGDGHVALRDPYPMEKNPDEVPMFARFVKRGHALPASDFFKGLLKYYGIEYLNLNPNGIFHVSVFVHFCEAFVGIKPHWILFWKFFRLKPQPSANDPRVVGGAGIQMREDAADQYLAYKLIDSNQDWKAKWFYVTNHHLELPKPSGKQPKHRAWWNTEPTMQKGIQLPELLQKIKALREAGLRDRHVAFSFMKRRVQPLMAHDTLGYQYTGDKDTSRMPGNEMNDEDIVERLGRIFKDMPPYTPCPIPKYSAAHPPNKVSSR
jgi:hypothetical protein